MHSLERKIAPIMMENITALLKHENYFKENILKCMTIVNQIRQQKYGL